MALEVGIQVPVRGCLQAAADLLRWRRPICRFMQWPFPAGSLAYRLQKNGYSPNRRGTTWCLSKSPPSARSNSRPHFSGRFQTLDGAKGVPQDHLLQACRPSVLLRSRRGIKNGPILHHPVYHPMPVAHRRIANTPLIVSGTPKHSGHFCAERKNDLNLSDSLHPPT
jgi:hypothetical protein